MKNKKHTKTIIFSILGAIAVIAMVVFGIFDLKISKSFDTVVNYYTYGFDFFGNNIIQIVSYILIWNLFNYWIIRNRDMFGYRAWMSTLTILGTGILFIVIYYFHWTTSGLNIDFVATKSTLIFGIPMIASTAIYATVIIWSKRYAKELVARYLFFMSTYGIMMIFMASISTGILKWVFGRPRPREILNYPWESDYYRYPFQITFASFRSNSFPSGHTNAACSMLVFIYFCSGRKKWHFVATTLFASSFIVATAVARILIHAHWTTDTLFAIIINFIWFWTAPLIVIRMQNPRRKAVMN